MINPLLFYLPNQYKKCLGPLKQLIIVLLSGNWSRKLIRKIRGGRPWHKFPSTSLRYRGRWNWTFIGARRKHIYHDREWGIMVHIDVWLVIDIVYVDVCYTEHVDSWMPSIHVHTTWYDDDTRVYKLNLVWLIVARGFILVVAWLCLSWYSIKSALLQISLSLYTLVVQSWHVHLRITNLSLLFFITFSSFN